MDIFLAKLLAQQGKVLREVKVNQTWKKDNVESITLVFEDGTKVSIYAQTEKGCMECDSDGSSCDYLDFS